MDLIQVRSKGRKPYWISRGLFDKYPGDYTEVKSKAEKKPRAKTAPKETPATPTE